MKRHAPLAEQVARQRARHHWVEPRDGGGMMSSFNVPDESLTSFLGWFSIGLGLAEALAPHALGKLIGTGSMSRYLPLFGAREIASGIGILANHRRAGWLWSRVGGDAMDLAFLGAAANARGADASRLAIAAFAVAGIAALDILESARQSLDG
jgi:hypothetical protein